VRTQLFILAAFFCGYKSFAQLSRTSLNTAKGIYTIKGDYYRDHRNYVFAINNYSKATKQNPKDVSAMLGMAEAYHKLGKDNLACQWYRKALATDPNVGEEHILQYILVLSSLGHSEEVRRWAVIYTDRVLKTGEQLDSAIFIADNLTSLNSKDSESGALLHDGKLIFSSDRASGGNFNSYKSVLNPDGNFEEVSSFHEAINPGWSEGAFAIAGNPATLFFTRTEQVSLTIPQPMEIFSSVIPSGPSDQVDINKLRFKNFDHSMGHPAVNSDGTVLYFTAHSPRHTRGFDLYRSEYNGKKWSAPVALGTSVNSHGDERYPVLSNDSILYFASNGHGGLGGFDIFKVNLQHKHHQRVEHLPAPVNSVADDFGLVINSSGAEGYLSSNRPGGLGGNDLYKIYILPAKRIRKTMNEAASKQEELLIYTSKGDEIKLSGSSKENLKFDFQPRRKYSLVVEYDNFRKGTTQTISNTAILTRLNIYTFDIQKSSEVVYDQKNKSKPIQDIHINPGDLVTFQLIPNLAQDAEADVGKIQFQRSEAIVSDRESILFSYVAGGDPGILEADMLPIADLRELDTLTNVYPVAAEALSAKSDKITPTSRMSSLVGNKSTNTAKQVSDTPITIAKVQPDLEPANNSITEKSETKDSLTLQPETAIALQEQRMSVKNKDADPVAVTGKAVEAQQQRLVESVQLQSGGKGSDSVNTQDVVIASKEGEKDLVPAKNVNDVTLMEQSGIMEKNVDANEVTANVAEAAPKNIVVPTESAITTSGTSQIPPLSPADTTSSNTAESNDIQYRVQIAASRSKLSDELLKKIYPGPREIRSFNEDGYHKYYIEQTPSYPSAKRALKESGIGQAFIAAYQGDTKLTLHEAVTNQKNADSQRGTSTTKSENTDPAARVFNVPNVQPRNATEILPENSVPVTADSSKEKQAPAVILKPLDISTKIAAREVNPHDNPEEKNLPANVAGSNETTLPIAPVTDVSGDATVSMKKDPVSLLSSDTVDTNKLVEDSDFLYRLQIAASKSRLSNSQLKKLYRGTNEIRVFKEEGLYKYYILETSNYFVARQTLKKSDAEQAFVSAYKKDVKLLLQEAIASQYKVPVIQSDLTEKDSIVKIMTVNFELDEFELQPDQVEHLQSTVIDELRRNQSYYAIVNGYTDIRGSEAYNFGLSQERALFVEQRIVAEGIDAGRVTTQYFGESQLVKYCPEQENCDETIHQANRRVEILLLVNKK
jgi:outer membrane protein OmpA-like peptidoglycan-associated protein